MDEGDDFQDDFGIFYASDDEEEVIWFREFLSELLRREGIQNPSFCMQGRTNDRPEIETLPEMMVHIFRKCVFTIIYISENIYRERKARTEAELTFCDRTIQDSDFQKPTGMLLLSNIADPARSKELLRKHMGYLVNRKVQYISSIIDTFYQQSLTSNLQPSEMPISWERIAAVDRTFRSYIRHLVKRLRVQVPRHAEQPAQQEVSQQDARQGQLAGSERHPVHSDGHLETDLSHSPWPVQESPRTMGVVTDHSFRILNHGHEEPHQDLGQNTLQDLVISNPPGGDGSPPLPTWHAGGPRLQEVSQQPAVDQQQVASERQTVHSGEHPERPARRPSGEARMVQNGPSPDLPHPTWDHRDSPVDPCLQARQAFFGDVGLCIDGGEDSLNLTLSLPEQKGASSLTYPKEKHQIQEGHSEDPTENGPDAPTEVLKGDPNTVLLINEPSDDDEFDDLIIGAHSLKIDKSGTGNVS